MTPGTPGEAGCPGRLTPTGRPGAFGRGRPGAGLRNKRRFAAVFEGCLEYTAVRLSASPGHGLAPIGLLREARENCSKSPFVCRATFMLQRIGVRCIRAPGSAPRRVRRRRRSSDVLARVRRHCAALANPPRRHRPRPCVRPRWRRPLRRDVRDRRDLATISQTKTA